MATATDNFGHIGASSKRLVKRLLTIGENRLELLTVEVQVGLAALRRSRSVLTDAKPSWLQTIFKGAGLISTFRLAFRSQGRNQKPNS